MATSNTMIGFGVVGLGLVVLFGYMAHASVDIQTYPDIELAAGAGLNAPTGVMPHEYVTQAASLVPLVNLPHRYPTVSGGNVTALIHHGLEPMRMRAPRDAKWIECPPGEVMF